MGGEGKSETTDKCLSSGLGFRTLTPPGFGVFLFMVPVYAEQSSGLMLELNLHIVALICN